MSLAVLRALLAALVLAGPSAGWEPETGRVEAADEWATLEESARGRGLSPAVLELALRATAEARRQGEIERLDRLTVIDYSLPSSERRLWVLDLSAGEVLFHELVAHGRNTGERLATSFSNQRGSKKSSLGLFRTAETYVGEHGWSLRLDGLERGVNDRARDRLLVMHGAWYVSEELIQDQGRIGRSWGCPALSEAVAGAVIDEIREGTLVFAYYPDERWLSTSRFLAPSRAPRRLG